MAAVACLLAMHPRHTPSASITAEATIATDMPFMAVFNDLVVFDPARELNRLDRVVPDLAKSWQLTDDDRALTFQLRDGVKPGLPPCQSPTRPTGAPNTTSRAMCPARSTAPPAVTFTRAARSPNQYAARGNRH